VSCSGIKFCFCFQALKKDVVGWNWHTWFPGCAAIGLIIIASGLLAEVRSQHPRCNLAVSHHPRVNFWDLLLENRWPGGMMDLLRLAMTCVTFLSCKNLFGIFILSKLSRYFSSFLADT